ncbi:uncharacterized protein G2W53_028391 [Senna tora]|uniref:Uncharacterized protein n=1 Tax=Senna tora TaxID=362788 RepID=A0A834T3G7_9FABA|nr:uncharacterized protein G2W53_028391 [Senna tora]
MKPPYSTERSKKERRSAFLNYFTGFKVIHTYKEGNSCADSLARHALLNGSAVLL